MWSKDLNEFENINRTYLRYALVFENKDDRIMGFMFLNLEIFIATWSTTSKLCTCAIILVKCDEKCRELPIVISDNIAKINTTNMPMPINVAKKQQNKRTKYYMKTLLAAFYYLWKKRSTETTNYWEQYPIQNIKTKCWHICRHSSKSF